MHNGTNIQVFCVLMTFAAEKFSLLVHKTEIHCENVFFFGVLCDDYNKYDFLTD